MTTIVPDLNSICMTVDTGDETLFPELHGLHFDLWPRHNGNVAQNIFEGVELEEWKVAFFWEFALAGCVESD